MRSATACSDYITRSARSTGTFFPPCRCWYRSATTNDSEHKDYSMHGDYSHDLSDGDPQRQEDQSTCDSANGASEFFTGYCLGASIAPEATCKKLAVAIVVGSIARGTDRNQPEHPALYVQYVESGIASTYAAMPKLVSLTDGPKGDRACDKIQAALDLTAAVGGSNKWNVYGSYLNDASKDPKMPRLLNDLAQRATTSELDPIGSWLK